jgi:ferredoxin
VRDRRTGRFLPACNAPAEDGMDLDASGEEVRALRRDAVALLLEEHAGDCEAPCRRACPFSLDVEGVLSAIRAGRDEDAGRLVGERIPFPGTIARICGAPCEGACVRGRVDEPLSIRALHAYAARFPADFGAPASGKSVAVVGGGASGLAVAWHLVREGHAVCVLERSKTLGGNLRRELGEDRAGLKAFEEDLDRLRARGATFRTETAVQDREALDALRAEFDAVILAWGEEGARLHADLGIGEARDGSAAGEEGLFVAGRASRPAKSAVRSAARARAASNAAVPFLRGEAPGAEKARFQSRLGRLREEEVEVLRRSADGGARVVPAGGDPLVLATEEARAESVRCLACGCAKAESCALRDAAEALGASPAPGSRKRRRAFEGAVRHGPVRFEAGKCILCGICVRIAEAGGEEIGLAFTGRGARTRVAPALGRRWDEALRRTASACAEACPTGALTRIEKTEAGA